MTVKQKMPMAEIYKRAWQSLDGKRLKMGLYWGMFAVIIYGCALLSAIGVGIIIDYLILPVLNVGLCIITLKQIRGQEFSFNDVWSAYGVMGTAVLLSLANSILISLWSLLFIIPGIIKSYDYSLCYFILADSPKMTQSEVREESCNLMDGNRVRSIFTELPMYVGAALIFIAFLLLNKFFGEGVAALGGLGLVCLFGFFGFPYYSAIKAVFYDAVKAENAPAVYVPIEEINQ